MSEGGSSLQYHRSAGSSSHASEIGNDSDYTPEFSQGMRAEVAQLYRPNDRASWSKWAPDSNNIDIEAGSYAQECALIVQREPHPGNGQVSPQSITVQSPLIRKMLDLTFEGFDGIDTRLKDLTFQAPFRSFYYRWHRFDKLRRTEQNQDTRNHVDLLYNILESEILPHIRAMEDFTKNKVISFDYLWAIFAPDMEIYTKLDGQDCILLLRESRYGANMSGEFFSLDCQYIECDGTGFGYVSTSVEISAFDGVKKLVDLDAIPGHLHSDVANLVDRLYARGEKLERLNGFHHMSYSGYYISRSSRQLRKRHMVNSRIIIDPHTFNNYSTPGSTLCPLEPDSPGNPADADLFDGVHNVIYQATIQRFNEFQNALAKSEKGREPGSLDLRKGLSTKQLLVCTPVIRGYCLASKTWAEFYIENVCQISWSENAFTSLVLPNGYKDIIRAFVQEQLSRDDSFDDIIHGKGLGFIMLLSGEPGVGKTLTAESIAEEMRRPLYSMSAGDLGETAADVEDSLELVLELATKWNAILLLDECDIFLQARTTTDIHRNRLISIFLRQLEYYRGVMFLTTNRISDFDTAFESRIHLTIHYPALDAESRLHIWKTFTSIGELNSQLSSSDLETLAKHEMNGRQIKNIIKTARLLSNQKRQSLAMEHVEMVLEVKKIKTGA